MNWLLFAAALVFAWLAYDAWKVTVPAKDVPYSVNAESLGQTIDGIPAQEQEKRRYWNLRYGIGDLSQIVWLWSILALACAIGSTAAFFA